MKFLYTYIGLFWCTLCWGQLSNDSIKAELVGNYEIDTNRINLILDSAAIYKKNEPTKAILFVEKALDFSENANYQKGIANSSIKLANIHYSLGDYSKAMINYQRAMVADSIIGNVYGVAMTSYNLALIYFKEGKYEKVLFYTEESAKRFEKIDDVEKLAYVYELRGRCLKYLGRYKEALEGLNFSKELFKKHKNVGVLVKAYNQIGLVYQKLRFSELAIQTFKNIMLLDGIKAREKAQTYNNLGNAYLDHKDYDSALHCFLLSYDLKRGGKKIDLATAQHNIALVYYHQNDLQRASVYLDSSKVIRQQINYLQGLAESYTLSGKISAKKEDWKIAQAHYRKAIAYAREADSPFILSMALRDLADLLIFLNQYQSAASYYEQTLIIRDSLKLAEREGIESERMYLEQQKEIVILKAEQQRNQAQSERNRIFNYAVFGTSAMFVVVIGSMFAGYRQRQRALLAEKSEQLHRKEAEDLIKTQELKIIHAMVEGQDEERKRIAQEIHDGLGNMLAMTKWHFQSMEETFLQFELRNQEQYNKANVLLDQAYDTVRNLSHRIGDSLLVKLGLLPALQDLVETLRSTENLQVDLHILGMEQRLPAKIEYTTFKIIQELITNILKHARANEITIQLIQDDRLLSITVEDNGVGFDPKQVDELSTGMGLSNIYSRAHEINGKIQIDSGKGNGTTVILEIVLDDIHSHISES